MSKLALYLRLSVDEYGKDESNSIINQRYLLNHFLDSTPEFKRFQREGFVDDGFSGASLKRPAFQRLIADVKAGQIKCILVKDLSRFMRDYLELGNYLENIFPFLGVRFIALNDQYDSLTSENNGVEIDIPFRNLLNDFYTKDVSKKVKSVMNTMKRSGKNMSWLPPFGYIKDPNNRFKIIIDDVAAPIVKRIFSLSIEGMGDQRIARLLNDEQTITPAERKMQVSQARYQKSIILTNEQRRNIWTKNTVRQILVNEAYKGTYLFNTRTTINGKQVKQPEEKWERTEHNHEAIVTSEEFEQAQIARTSRISGKTGQVVEKSSPTLLKGLVFCEHCNHRLPSFKNHNGQRYFYCLYCKSQGVSIVSCRMDKIEQAIFKSLKNQLRSPSFKISKTVITSNIKKIKAQKVACFQDYKENGMSREDYIDKKQKLDKMIVDLERQLQLSSNQVFADQKLTRDMVETYVQKVIVDCLGFFKVVYK